MNQVNSVADLRERAAVAVKLNQDLKTVARVLEDLGATDLAGMALALDVVDFLTLPPDKAAEILEKLTEGLEGLHCALAKYAAFTQANRFDDSTPS